MSLNAMLQEERLESDLTIPPTSSWSETSLQRVVVTGVRIPFGSAMALLLKWALAAIPAVLLLIAVGAAAYLAAVQLLP